MIRKKSNFTYDLLIIGGGISACVFASKYLQNNITPLIESDFSSLEKLDSVYSFLENER